MNEDIYWQAQSLICRLENRKRLRRDKSLSKHDNETLDFLLALPKP